MACDIQIAGVEAERDRQGAVELIRVVGTSSDCTRIRVALLCHGDEIVKDVDVRVNGLWRAEFTAVDLATAGCQCGHQARVTATCLAPDACSATLTTDLHCCPEFSRFRAIVLDAKDCAGQDRTVRARFEAYVVGGDADTELTWDPGDGTGLITSVPTSPRAIAIVDHTYTTPGEFTVVLTLRRRFCVQQAQARITIPSCCGRVVDLAAVVEDCTLRAFARVDPPSTAGTFTWEYGDGASETVSPPSSGFAPLHRYASAGRKRVRVTYRSSPECEPSSREADVEVPADCRGGNGGGGGGGSNGCVVLKLAATIFFAASFGTTLVALMLSLCKGVPVPFFITALAAGLSIAAVISIAAWRLACRYGDCPCPTACDLLEIGWISLFAAGLIGLYLYNCCDSAAWRLLVIGFLAGGTGLMTVWISRCVRTSCQITQGLFLAFSTVFGEADLILSEIDLFDMCKSTLVHHSVVATSILLGVAVLACLRGEE